MCCSGWIPDNPEADMSKPAVPSTPGTPGTNAAALMSLREAAASGQYPSMQGLVGDESEVRPL